MEEFPFNNYTIVGNNILNKNNAHEKHFKCVFIHTYNQVF